MQFNPNSTSGIVYMTRFYAKANSSDLTTADIANLSNIALGEIYPELPFLSRTIIFDDPNYTDDPYESQTLTSGTFRYSLETDGNGAAVSSLRKVAVKDSNGVLQIIPIVSLDDVEAESFIKETSTGGVPQRAIISGNDLLLDPTPNYTVANGLKLFYDRALDQFSSSDITATPGFHESFHELIPLINANRVCIKEGKFSTARELESKILQQKMTMKKFYGGINSRGMTQRMSVRQEDNR